MQISQTHTANSSSAGIQTHTPDTPPGGWSPTHSPFLGTKQGHHVQALPCLASVCLVQGRGDRAKTPTSLPGTLSTSLSAPFSVYWNKSGRTSACKEMALLFLTLQHPPP